MTEWGSKLVEIFPQKTLNINSALTPEHEKTVNSRTAKIFKHICFGIHKYERHSPRHMHSSYLYRIKF